MVDKPLQIADGLRERISRNAEDYWRAYGATDDWKRISSMENDVRVWVDRLEEISLYLRDDPSGDSLVEAFNGGDLGYQILPLDTQFI